MGKRVLELAILLVAALLPVACGTVTGVEEPLARVESQEDRAGSALIHISLGSVALAKKADTTITLDTLHLVLTSAGCPTRNVNVPVSGNINASALDLTAKVEGLNPLRNWKVKAYTHDLADTVMHMDSTTFSAKLRIFDVKLSHKYVKAGTSATFLLQALDRASPARVKYSQSVTLTPRASGDSTVTVQLQ